MPAFGERLKRERESHDTTIEQIAAASGIGQSYLEALERDEFGALPGPAFGKLYIRAYAEVLGFDPQPWIDDYDRERRAAMLASFEPPPPAPTRARPVGEALAQWRGARIRERDAPAGEPTPSEAAPVDASTVGVAPVEVAPVEAASSELAASVVDPPGAIRESPPPDVSAHRSRRPIAIFVSAGVLVGLAVIYLTVFRRGPETRTPLPGRVPNRALVEPSPTPAPSAASAPAMKPPTTPRPETPIARDTPPPRLVVTESGVGRRIVNLRLEGEADTFPEGSHVVFSSRVIGGRSGAILRHVWIRDGRIEQSIPLRLGGSDWRTHSTKTLGRPGAWSVEARDEEGRVLASASFACVPAGR